MERDRHDFASHRHDILKNGMALLRDPTRMGLSFCILLLLGAPRTGPPASHDPLSTRVGEFEFHGGSHDRGHVERGALGGMVEAVRALVSHAAVPINVEGLPSAARTVPIEIKLEAPASVREILWMMIDRDPRYELREDGEPAVVRPTIALDDPDDCLNSKVPRFKISYPWFYGWHSVSCLVNLLEKSPSRLVPDPAVGCGGGTGSPPCHTDELIEVDLTDTTLLEIANQVVVRGGNFAWSAEYDGEASDCGSLRLGVYQPAGCYPFGEQAENQPQNWVWVKGLPPDCRNCHYHRKGPP